VRDARTRTHTQPSTALGDAEVRVLGVTRRSSLLIAFSEFHVGDEQIIVIVSIINANTHRSSNFSIGVLRFVRVLNNLCLIVS